jgi:hypothetical protein
MQPMAKRASVEAAAVVREGAYAPDEMTRPRWNPNLSRALAANFKAIAVASVTVYLVLEIAYVLRLPLIADEFDGAYDVYQLRSKLPYVDFKPYKTVVGYYLQLPPLLIAQHVWHGLIASKVVLAVANAALTLWAALLVARRFSARAAALALPCWVLMSDWLERSAELRVDTLTAWAGLFALIALIDGRHALSGFLTALSFLISQKGFYFLVGSGAGMVAVALLSRDVPLRAHARDMARFGAAYALTIGAYVAFWALVGSLSATTTATFLSHRTIVFADIYPNIRRFWWQTLVRNPGYYALIAIAVGWLSARAMRRAPEAGAAGEAAAGEAAAGEAAASHAEHAREALLFGYAVLFATCIVWHKQPWPYFFVLLVPTAFVVQTWLFEHAFRAYGRHARAKAFATPAARGLVALLALGAAAGCVAFPALRIPPMLRLRNGYQHHMIDIAEALTKPGDHYVAASDMLYDRVQSSGTLRRVSLARRRELSWYPGSWSELIMDDLTANPPKVLIHNERFDSFPKRVRKYLRDNYAQYWGVVDLYAPKLEAGRSTLNVAFDGRYRLTGVPDVAARIGDATVKNNQTVSLKKGPIEIDSEQGGRLTLLEKVPFKLNRRMERRRAFFGNGYSR